MLLTDDEYTEFAGSRRRKTGPSNTPVSEPHPDYAYNTTSSYDWSEPDFNWADTLPDVGAGNDPFGYLNPQDIGLQPDRPTFDPWEGDQFQDLMGIGVDNRRDETYGLNFDWTFAPGMDSGGLDTMQPADRGPDVMMGVGDLAGWDPSMSTRTFDGGYDSDRLAQNALGLGVNGPVQSGITDFAKAAYPVVDKYFLKPSDALTEATYDLSGALGTVAFGPEFMDLLAGTSQLLPGMDYQSTDKSLKETVGNIRDPGSAAEDYRARPWQEQVALGVGFDPTNLIPFNLGAAKGAYESLLGPEGKLVTGLAKAQGREGMNPAIGLSVDFTDDMAERASRWEPADEDWLSSAIANDKGKPQVLYHGSRESGLDTLLPGTRQRGTAHGLFFTTNPDVADFYGPNRYAVHVTDAGMLDLTSPASFENFARAAVGLEGDDLADAARWHDEGILYNGYGSARLQNDIVDTAQGMGFKGVIFNDATGEFGVNPSFVLFDEVPTNAGLSGGSDALGARGGAKALAKGTEVFDPVTGKTLTVARKFSGDEQGMVSLVDPETGDTVKRVRGLLKDEAGDVVGTGTTDPLRPDLMRSEADVRAATRSNYFDGTGAKTASSREVPQAPDDYQLGEWIVDTEHEGLHGRQLWQLREYDPAALVSTEALSPARAADSERYAEWVREGRQIPPIWAVTREDGSIAVMDGHRRLQAATALGQPIRVWVSDLAPHPKGWIDSNTGEVIKVALTDKLAKAQTGEVLAPPKPAVSIGARSADGASPVDVPTDLKLPRTSDGSLEPPRTLPPAPSGDQSFQQAILNHLRGEWYYRISGTAKQELKEGRKRQFEGIMSGLESTGDSTDALAAARAGASGRILSTREPLVLTPAQRVQANDELIAAVRTGRIGGFDVLTVQDGLEAMLRGERPQPAQMRKIRAAFNDDIADLAYQMPVNEAVRQRQMVADAKKVAENWEKSVAKEVKRRQAEVATAQNEAGKAFEKVMAAEKRAQAAADAAAKKAVDAARKAEEKEILESRRYGNEVAEKAVKDRQKDATKAYEGEFKAAMGRDAAVARARKDAERAAAKAAKAADDADRAEIAAARRYQQEVQQRAERDAQKSATREYQAEAKAAEARDVRNPNEEQIIRKAKAQVAKTIAPEHQETANAIIDTWVDANRVLLDGIGEASNNSLKTLARNIRAGVSGHLGDSYVTQLVTQRTILRGTLEQSGMDPDLAKKLTNQLMEQELARRYKGNVPERIRDLIQKSKGSAYNDELGTIARGAASVNQAWKNTAFGPADIGVAGVQGLHAVQTAGAQIAIGMVNRIASMIPLMPHVDVTGEALARRAQYALDGLMSNPTGAADVSQTGTVLGLLGPIGRTADAPLRGLINLNNRFSFGFVMGNLRALAHEGNLVLAKAMREDISDPAIRRASAIRANSATSAAFRASSSRRALGESATLMTSSMTRAQVQQVGQIVQGFIKPTSRADFVMSAATIASAGISMYAFGKVLNDAVGMDEFVWDPREPGWGSISIEGPGGRVYKVNVFPQEQIAKYTIQAIDALTKADPGEAREAMVKLGLGRSGPALQVAEKAAGYGFDNVNGGYAMGDWGKGMPALDRVMSMIGLPPTIAELLGGERDPAVLGGGFMGLPVYEESPNITYDRKWQESTGGKKWADLNTDEKAAIEREYGPRPNSSNPEFAKSQRESDIIKFNRQTREYQATNAYKKAMDSATTESEKRYAGQKLREEMGRIGDIAGAQYDQWSAGKEFGPQNPMDEARGQYYDTFKLATEGGVLDEEKQQALLAALEAKWSDPQKEYVQEAIGRRKESDNPVLQELYDAQKAIRDSGYYEVAEKKREWRMAHPEIDALLRKYNYGETTTKAMDVDARLTSQQQADDDKLKAENYSESATKAWRERYDSRETERAAAKDVLYGDLPEKERDALSMYYNVIDTLTEENGEIDWDAVDRWVKRAPSAVREALASRPDTSSTPLVKEFRDARKEIGTSGYWDVSDAAAQQFTGGQYTSMTKLRTDVYNAAYSQAVAAGYTSFQAKNLAEIMASDYLSDIDDAVSKWRENWRRQPENFETVKSLIKWGYWTPGKKDSLAIAGAAGLDWH